MIPTLDALRDRLGFDLRELAGARVSGEIPINEGLVNTLIAERLAGHPQIASVRVQAQPGDNIAVQLTPRSRMMPALRINARIERQPEFPSNPVLMLRWSMPAAGPLALLAAPVLAYFKAMPPGLRMDGDQIAVDVRQLLRGRGLDEMMGFIRRVEIHTMAGGFLARFDLGI